MPYPACPRCGSTRFVLYETTEWNCIADKSGTLSCGEKVIRVETIECRGCGLEGGETDFKSIKFR